MKVCNNCKNSFDEAYNFCPHCGNKVLLSASDSEKYEFCEIQIYSPGKQNPLNAFFNPALIFAAVYYNKDGAVIAGESEKILQEMSLFGHHEWHKDDNGEYHFSSEGQKKHNGLVKKLIANGWEHIGVGDRWYKLKFRRLVK